MRVVDVLAPRCRCSLLSCLVAELRAADARPAVHGGKDCGRRCVPGCSRATRAVGARLVGARPVGMRLVVVEYLDVTRVRAASLLALLVVRAVGGREE